MAQSTYKRRPKMGLAHSRFPKTQSKTCFEYEGRITHISQFPEPTVARWGSKRKRILCEAILSGFMTPEELSKLYPKFTPGELKVWAELYKETGQKFLKGKDLEHIPIIPQKLLNDSHSSEVVSTSKFTLHPNDSLVHNLDGKVLRLLPGEARVLRILFHNKGTVVLKAEMLVGLYGQGPYPGQKILDVRISMIRKKMKENLGEVCILTHWGRGYSVPE